MSMIRKSQKLCL